MMRKTVLTLLPIFALGFALRVGLAVHSPSIFYPDEIFQTLEPAHKLVYGYGVVTWEWRDANRSWVFPGFLAGVMRATSWMGRGSSGYLLGIEIVLSLLSLATVWFGYAWAKRVSGAPAGIVAALGCSFYFGLVYFAPKAFSEVVAAHVMLPGLYIGAYGDQMSQRKRLFLAGLFCGLAACLRIQLLPALLFAVAYFCYPKWRERIGPAAAGFIVPVLLFGLVDWATWSYPWESFVRYVFLNVQSKEAMGAAFGASPWYWYGPAFLVLIGPAVLFLVYGIRRSPFLAVFCGIVLVSHSLIPHKGIRYIYPILAPAVILVAIGAVEFLQKKDQPRTNWVIVPAAACLLISSGFLAVLGADWYKPNWGTEALDRLGDRSDLCGVGMYAVPREYSGGYTHLHRNVPFIPIDDAVSLIREAPTFNALIAPQTLQPVPVGFKISACWNGVCLRERPGACAPLAGEEDMNAYLRRIGR
jgi:phosphatidylinositol glycan class B